MDWTDRRGLHNMPGLPEPTYTEAFDTLIKLRLRKEEFAPAVDKLPGSYMLGSKGATGQQWLFGDPKLYYSQLFAPTDFSMSWTHYKGVYERARPYRAAYASTLTSVEAANKAFWPIIAEEGTAYNLLILRKVTDGRFVEYKELLEGPDVEKHFARVQQQGRLYELDFSIFESFPARIVHDHPRFNPATLTLLERHETDKGVFEPKWIRVWSGKQPGQTYSPLFQYQTDSSWLYALQAVKSSVTLYGIWLGHVYHWHMVTAAMQGAMYDTISDSHHAVRRLLQPQSDYLIAFDYVLLDGMPRLTTFSEIAPPSCIADADSFLKLTDTFAAGRQFFDDDPLSELANNGLRQADFTRDQSWDMYPVARKLLQIWHICERFVSAFVSHTYRDDHAVAVDKVLQDWMTHAADPRYGNIRGLPVLDNVPALRRVLTSLVYRVTAHGLSRFITSSNPALTFVANFPPCLQNDYIPGSNEELGRTSQLLGFLPHTTTIGEMMAFYFAFTFSKPYVPLLGDDLYFDGGLAEPRNAALMRYRREMATFMGDTNIYQWPRNIET